MEDLRVVPVSVRVIITSELQSLHTKNEIVTPRTIYDPRFIVALMEHHFPGVSYTKNSFAYDSSEIL